jgi:hypothetical protein
MTGTLRLPAGSAAAPALLLGSATTGIYDGGEIIGFATSAGGNERMSIGYGGIKAGTSIQFKGQDGTALAPAYSFTGEADTGIYHPAVNRIGFAAGGVERMTIDTASIISTVTVTIPVGSAAYPSLNFTGDTNTGLYDKTADTLGFATGGVERMSIDSVGTVTINALGTGVVHSAGGTLTSSLIVDSDITPLAITNASIANATITGGKIAATTITNANIATAAAIADAKLATISTALKVSNSATTASSINAANAIVARDSTSTFTATGITATNFYGTLTGAASSNVLKTGDSMTGPLIFPTGVSAPSITFAGHTDTGIYEYGGGTISFKANDTEAIRMTPNGILTRDGSEGLPSISFISDNNTGIYHPAPVDTMGFVAGGGEIMRTTTAGVTIKKGLDLERTATTLNFNGTNIYYPTLERPYLHITMVAPAEDDDLIIRLPYDGRAGQMIFVTVQRPFASQDRVIAVDNLDGTVRYAVISTTATSSFRSRSFIIIGTGFPDGNQIAAWAVMGDGLQTF